MEEKQKFVVGFAKPGPAFRLSKEGFKKLQNSNSAEENHKRLQENLARYRGFKNIKDETRKLDEHAFLL